MFRDITLGQYYPTESVIHSLDPRVKLFSAFIFIISLFLFDDVPGFVFITICMAGFIALSHVPVSFMLRGLRSIVVLLLVAATFNMLLTPGRELFCVWIFKVTDAGLKNAILMSIRMIYLIVGTSVMTLTTTPNALTNGLEKSMNPFSKIGVPVHEIAMMMSIALRFIPILIEETDKIMKAQMARGADFETGGLIRRARAMVPLLVPLFVSAFRRAGDLALAMEARCYNGGDGRTKMKPLRYVRRDRVAYALVLLYLAVLIAWKLIR